jgi:aspartate/glutamate/glutamine transport system substrate-binding protein
MARKLRELTAFMAVLLLSLVLTACSHSQSSSTYDRVKQTNTITWGMRPTPACSA